MPDSGAICSIAICKNNSKKAKKAGEKLIFFSFPKNMKIRNEWIKKCQQSDQWNANRKKICSRHFKTDDFNDELQASLLNIQPKILKKNAIPTLHLLPEDEKKVCAIKATQVENMEDKTLIDYVGISQIPSSNQGPDIDVLQRKFEVLQQKFRSLLHENTSLKEKISHHRKIMESLRKKVKEDRKKFDERIKLSIKDILTFTQAGKASNKNTKARWTEDELATAYMLRYLNKRCYVHLRNTLHFPLPGLPTLHRWAVHINLKNGVLEDVLLKKMVKPFCRNRGFVLNKFLNLKREKTELEIGDKLYKKKIVTNVKF